MSIHRAADENHFVFHETERAAASALDEGFDVTHGGRHRNFSYWIAKPHRQLVERFGFDKELLVLYSSFPKTDARVFTAFEDLLSDPSIRLRVDQYFLILVHAGPSEEALHLVNTQQERVILCLQRDELEHGGRGSLYVRSRIAECVGGVDLFGMSSPITSDRYLFGRTALIQTLVKRITATRENSGLFGLRKTGKTSVLFAIQRRLEKSAHLSIYVDCQNPSTHGARWWQLLEEICDRLAAEMLRQHSMSLPVPDFNAETAGRDFAAFLRSLLASGPIKQAVILLDEIEFITPGLTGAVGKHWQNDFIPFWGAIRASNQETQGGLVFVIAGVNPAYVEKSHFDGTPNPILQLAQPTFLDPLDQGSIREMIRTIGKYTGMSFSETVFAYMRSAYGGHPYLIRLATSVVYGGVDLTNPLQRPSVAIRDYEQASPQIQSRLQEPIKDILLSLVWWYPEEYDLLLMLAEGNARDREFVADWLKEFPASAVQFARYGLLQDNGTFAIDDLRVFLSGSGRNYKQEVSAYRNSDVPPHILPSLPDAEALGELFSLRTRIEYQLRQTIMLYIGIAEGWNNQRIANRIAGSLAKRPGRKEPLQLFIGSEPRDVMAELYTSDLKDIILGNWDVFKQLFASKGRFEDHMTQVNIGRRLEAHAKPVTPAEAEEFRASANWLLSKLRPVEASITESKSN